MGARTEKTKSHVQKVRIYEDDRTACLEAKSKSRYWSRTTESDFYGYLITLGIEKYEKMILPGESSDSDIDHDGRQVSNG
jgi:hypothetical protein